jgi:hypothetical protein
MGKGGLETQLRVGNARCRGRLLRATGLRIGIWTLLGRKGAHWGCRGPAWSLELFGTVNKREKCVGEQAEG